MSIKLLLPLSLLLLFAPSSLTVGAASHIGTVTHIIDGDTIIVRINTLYERIRLIGIDAPEIQYGDGLSDCYAREASRELRKKIAGKTIELETDTASNNRDTYGRLLRYIRLNGEDINRFLVERGAAKVYRRYEFSRRNDFDSKEKDARLARRGVWSCKKK